MTSTLPFEELKRCVIRWADQRNIGTNPRNQLMKKTTEELAELIEAEAAGSRKDVAMEVGDVLVTLIIYCDRRGLDPVECLEWAYLKIRERKGTTTPDGVFVKESA